MTAINHLAVGVASFIVPGSPESSAILHVPHSSTVIPADVRRALRLDDKALAVDLLRMTDSHTALIAGGAADRAASRPWMFVNPFSRLVIDPERFTDQAEEMEAVGMGAVYTRTSHGEVLRDADEAARQKLLDTYLTPYAQALADLTDERLDALGRVTLIDVHSFPSIPLPYELHADLRHPGVCIGTDTFHTPDYLTRVALAAFSPVYDILLDEPFIGTYVPTRHYGLDERVNSVMVEMRRDLYMDENSGEPSGNGVEALSAHLAVMIDAISTASPASTHH